MLEKKRPVFDLTLCVSCAVCVQACPISCIRLDRKGEKDDTNLYPALAGDCTGCGSCERACPMSAIALSKEA